MCMIDYADGDWTLLSQAHPRARKTHRCYDCYRTIEPGEMYDRTVAVSDMGMETYALCAHCSWAAEWLRKQCNGFLFGGVLEDLEEHWNEHWELRSLDLGRRIVGMRRRWKRFDGAGLMEVPAA